VDDASGYSTLRARDDDGLGHCPFNLSNSVEAGVRDLAACCARVLHRSAPLRSRRGRREDRVSADTRGPRAAKKHAAEPQVQPNNRPSLRWFERLIRALPRDRPDCPRVATTRDTRCARHQHRDARTTRFRRRIRLFARMKRSCCKPTRPPHLRLNVRDDREAPLVSRKFGRMCERAVASRPLLELSP
jgi:hypothetical protein